MIKIMHSSRLCADEEMLTNLIKVPLFFRRFLRGASQSDRQSIPSGSFSTYQNARLPTANFAFQTRHNQDTSSLGNFALTRCSLIE